MERLTRPLDELDEQRIIACDNCIRGLGVENPPCATCDYENAALDRLAAYEDTGLTPEEILWTKMKAEAAEAERDVLARYINGLDIDEDVCKKHDTCEEFGHTEEDCIRCIIKTIGRNGY